MELNLKKKQRIQVTLTMPAELQQRIDALRDQHKANRSAIIVALLEKALSDD